MRLVQSSAGRHLTLRAARVRAARIGALLLNFAVPLLDLDRALPANSPLQHSALRGGRLGGKPLDKIPRAVALELPLLRPVSLREGEFGQFRHVHLPAVGLRLACTM